MVPSYKLPQLPPKVNLECAPVLRALVPAHRYLAELKGGAPTIPNQDILIDSLTLQEARASSELENIVTTQDELFRADFSSQGRVPSAAAKEVSLYREALRHGYQLMKGQQDIISNNTLISMYRLLKDRTDGFRTTPGTHLKNEATGERVYTPPQDAREIVRHMGDLENFINDPERCRLDPLIKMALIHHQFESIHPFADGNGRIGRILNVLYLKKSGLLDAPILYLSRAIVQTKGEYYNLLQAVRSGRGGAWENWVCYILRAVTETSQTTLKLIKGMRRLMLEYKQRIRDKHRKIYSQDLLNNLFRHPYTRIQYMQRDLNVSRQTARAYLEQLSGTGLLDKHRQGGRNYYINAPLVELFTQEG